MSKPPTLDRRWSDMLFGVRRSIRYHQRRRAFFDRWDQLGNVFSLVFGSAAIYGVLEADYKTLALVASGLVTILSAVNLVFASAQRARLHHDFARKFQEIEQEMLVSPDEQVLQDVSRKRLDVEADEPPVLHVLNCLCHNEQMRADGYPASNLAKIKWWQRMFAHFVDLREDLIHA
ncbi:hypothetical protein DIE14_23100 [Burkholderia sp. Bp9017]|uniref:hypothetical protein n=1 Tax=unclassified Burkholderia TaxID=2613784 RepID=UPI000F5FCA09|nr:MULTISPECIES: hypothetical protein [unclassified Burkholderia]RQZ24047.1 hypothetical protein DIE14_23100 [Burkholderia sp. Bp9017]RQZ31987.1 hypothetical protein DIE13_22970 [Burkholderia sp. Bp9016]